ncbi:MAG: molybdopterin-binding protein, partial [Candidatus Hodarchaeales archaeon]
KILTLPDDSEIVSEEISQAISEGKFRIILITGGLGPTWDDSTAKFLAKALDVPIELNSEALAIVTRRYQDLFEKKLVNSAEITPARKKMAILPVGAVPIDNPVGTAAGIFVDLKILNTWIFCFPGVPREMEEMYKIIEPQLVSLTQEKKLNYYDIEFTTVFKDESLLAPFLEKVLEKYDVWIKSLPNMYQEEDNIRLIISKSSKSNSDSKKVVLAAKTYFIELVNSFQSNE